MSVKQEQSGITISTESCFVLSKYSFPTTANKKTFAFQSPIAQEQSSHSQLTTKKQAIKRQQANPFHNLSSSSNRSLLTHRRHQVLRRLSRLHTHTLLTQQINKQGGRTVILAYTSGVDGLVLLVALHVVDVHVEKVGGVHWSAFGLGVELGGEDGAGFVDHAWD
jgi:hypothetical protein